MALDAKWKTNNGSERQNENERLWTPKRKMWWYRTKGIQWLWMPNRKNGSERQTKSNNYECRTKTSAQRQTKTTTLNAKLKKKGVIKCQIWKYDSECQTEKRWWLWMLNENDMMTLNAELGPWLWTPKLKCGFERQTERRWDNPKCRPKTMALNAKLKQRPRMPNYEQ